MTKKKFIPLDLVDSGIRDEFLDIAANLKSDFAPGARLKIVVDVNAGDIRREYALGKIDANLASEYDLFKKKSTTITGHISRSELVGVVIEDHF
jgi:hypothetical protein